MRDQRDICAVVLAAMPGTQVQIVASTGLSAAAVSRWSKTVASRVPRADPLATALFGG